MEKAGTECREPRGPELESPTLREIWTELHEAGERARELAGSLDGARLRWRPGPDRWSVADCLEHLVLTGEEYLPALDGAIEEARRKGWTGPEPYRRTLLGRWLPGTLEPPPRFRVPAPKVARPRRTSTPPGPGPDDAGDELARFLALRGRFGRRLEEADGLDLGRARMSSPFLPLVRLDLDSAFRLIAAHERRHLWQAEQVTQMEGFPRG